MSLLTDELVGAPELQSSRYSELFGMGELKKLDATARGKKTADIQQVLGVLAIRIEPTASTVEYTFVRKLTMCAFSVSRFDTRRRARHYRYNWIHVTDDHQITRSRPA